MDGKITPINVFDDTPQKALEEVLELVKSGQIKDLLVAFEFKSDAKDNDIAIGYRTTADMPKMNWLLDAVKLDLWLGGE